MAGGRQERKRDTDKIWKGGIGILLILLLLFLGIGSWILRILEAPSDLFFYTAILMMLYGGANLAAFCIIYFIAAKNINGILYRFSDMVENLIGGKENLAFPMAEDTVLSKLQEQLFRLYDILRSYEDREHQFRKQLNENIGNLVHQINTPITNLKIYAGFLKRDDLTEEEKIQFARCMEDQAEKLRWLGEGFSKMSRLETGIIRQKPKKQEILPVILNAVNQVMEKAGQKEMDIRLAGEQHIWAVIDGKWTSEAVFNVLDNAVKYGNRGSVIEIELAELTGYAQILIRNEGIGIGREEYHKVFQRFYRGKKAAEEEGVGLGLTIAREVLEGERGYIKVETLCDGRTEFSLYLSRYWHDMEEEKVMLEQLKFPKEIAENEKKSGKCESRYFGRR